VVAKREQGNGRAGPNESVIRRAEQLVDLGRVEQFQGTDSLLDAFCDGGVRMASLSAFAGFLTLPLYLVAPQKSKNGAV